MAEIIKIGDQFFVEFIGNGLRFQKCAGVDWERAQQLKGEIEDSLKHGVNPFVSRVMECDRFWSEYSDQVLSQYPSTTQNRLMKTIEHFKKWLITAYPKIVYLHEITPRIVQEYKRYLQDVSIERHRRVKSKVINFVLFLLKMIFEEAVRRGDLNDNPTFHLEFIPIQRFGRAIDGLSNDMDGFLKVYGQMREEGRGGLSIDNCRTCISQLPLEEQDKLEKLTAIQLRRLATLNLLEKKVPLIKICSILGFDDVIEASQYLG